MRVVVQKYGGSSLASPEQIKRIAARVVRTREQGFHVVVVVSALGDTTDHLQSLADAIARNPSPRELDMLLSVGERVSIALLAMAIQELGHPAISFTGSQVGIITSTDHTRARILEIRGERIRKELRQGKVVVVAGYQGVSVEKEITTLGRGGSDTTAVALAAALQAERCEIMSDVDGVYTTDPRTVHSARLLADVTYDEMLEMADCGAQVLKASAVEFAKRHNIRIHVGSSFSGNIGTIVTDGPLDRRRLSAVVPNDQVVRFALKASLEAQHRAIRSLAREGVAVKFIKAASPEGTLIVSRADAVKAGTLLQEHLDGAAQTDSELALLSVVGVGINFGTDVLAQALDALAEAAVVPDLVAFSETRLTFGVPRARLQQATRVLHDALFHGKLQRSGLTIRKS